MSVQHIQDQSSCLIPILFAVNQNVSPLEQAQLIMMMRKLSAALEGIADAVVITDRDGRIEFVNAAFEGLTGYSRDEALGKTPSLLRSGQHDQEFYQELWQAILQDRVFRAKFINRRKDGSLFYEEKTITPLTDANGVITHFVSTGRDVTVQWRKVGVRSCNAIRQCKT